MVEKQRVSYPKMSTNNWWALRKKFIQSMPTNVTASYLSAILSMAENSASTNVLRPLKIVGLVDQENKPADRAFKWRDDDQYNEACKEIREAVYPQELLDAFSGPNIDRSAVERWFRNNARVGESAASKLASFYLLLIDADPSQQDKSANSGQGPKPPQKSKDKKEKSSDSTAQGEKRADSPATPEEDSVKQNKVNDGPSLHIDVQVHISSDASAEQIDSIFASMAKHLYKTNVT